MLAREFVLDEIGGDDRFAIALPLRVRPILYAGNDVKIFEGSSLIELPLDGQDVEERQTRLEVDRNVRLLETQIREQRAEPAIGFDHAFEQVVLNAARKIRDGPDQQAPAGLRACDQAAPNLHVSRLGEGCQERG